MGLSYAAVPYSSIIIISLSNRAKRLELEGRSSHGSCRNLVVTLEFEFYQEESRVTYTKQFAGALAQGIPVPVSIKLSISGRREAVQTSVASLSAFACTAIFS